MNWFDRIPLYLLAPPCVLLALSPLGSQPHLIQKLQMLFSGDLSRGVDIFDLLVHAVPTALLLFKIYRMVIGPKVAN